MSIKYLDQKMTEMLTTVEQRQPDTLPSNTIQNQNNDRHCMTITTREGNQTIGLPMSFEQEIYTSKYVVDKKGESESATDKEVVVTENVVPIPIPPPPFPHNLVKKTKEGKYHRFIAILKNLSINDS